MFAILGPLKYVDSYMNIKRNWRANVGENCGLFWSHKTIPDSDISPIGLSSLRADYVTQDDYILGTIAYT